MTTINSTYITLAQNYLATKERTPHYEIRYITDCCPADGWSALEAFTNDEKAKLVELRGKYGKDDFFNHLEEIFDEDRLDEVVPGEIFDIDLETPHYVYEFTYHKVTDDGMKTGTLKINLNDETYTELLARHLDDSHLHINSLRYADRKLYDILTSYLDNSFCYDGFYDGFYPYTVTMDELKSDAQKIREQHPDEFMDLSCITGYFVY